MRTDEIERHLIDLQRSYDGLPEANEPPPTTLQILGRNQRERYWQRLFAHFLTPSEAHGLNEDMLKQFLNGLSAHPNLTFSYSRLDLRDVKVETEVETEQGRPDLIIWSEESWYVCIEMKVGSSEGDDQTQRYVDVDSFTGIGLEKDDFPTDNQHYLYLAPENTPSPDAEEFDSISWEWLVPNLQSFLSESYGEYPSRTTAQLKDFIDTIRSELTMTEYEQNRRERVALAIKHYEPMRAVLDELDDYVEELQETWPDWFLEQSPTGWDNNWKIRDTGNSYHSCYRNSWAVNYPGDDGSSSSSDLYVYWRFRTAPRFLGEQSVHHKIEVTGENNGLRERFRENYYNDTVQKKSKDILASISTESNKKIVAEEWDDPTHERTYESVIEGEYTFESNDGNGFTHMVAEAFEDLQPVFDLVTESIPE